MAGPEVVTDADVVDEQDTPTPPEQPGTDVAVVPQTGGAIIRAEQPDEILKKAGAIATSLAKLIEDQGLAVNVGGRKKHVEVGGWQALGTMLGALGGQPLHAETVWTRKVAGPDGQPERTRYTATVKRYYKRSDGGGLREEVTYEVDGFDWEAKVEIRTPDGTIVGSAEAMVSRTEETWNQRDDFALRSMAETRAESRAYRRACGWIVNLAGYSPTPAEEMGHTPGADSVPGWTNPATAEMKKNALGWIAAVLERAGVEKSRDVARNALKEIAGHAGGELPDLVAKAAVIIARQFPEPSQATAAGGDASPASPTEPSPPPVDTTYLGGTVVVEGTPAEQGRTDRQPLVDLDTARKICECEGGYDATQIRLANEGPPKTADTCPIINHGIPF